MTRTARKPRSDGQATRAAILRAAYALFAEHGYEGTTVRAIAGAAGCNQALISRYFGSKAELFAIVVTGRPRDARERALPDVPYRALGRALVGQHLHTTAGASRDHLRDSLLMLLRSATTERGSRMLREFLAELDLAQHLSGERIELRTALIHAQLMGLTLLRDVVGLPELRGADTDTIARYLGAGVQGVLATGHRGAGERQPVRRSAGGSTVARGPRRTRNA